MIKSGLSQAVNIFALPFAGGISSSSTDILQATALLFAFNVVLSHQQVHILDSCLFHPDPGLFAVTTLLHWLLSPSG